EQLLARQVAAALDDAREPGIRHRDGVLDAALTAKAEAQHRAVDLEVAAAQRGQAVGAVLAHVFIVSHPDQRLVQQHHHRGEQLPAAEIRRTQIALDALAQARQHFAEFEHAPELRAVAGFAIAGVIAILLAPAGIGAGGLNVALRVRADPYLGPRGRDREPVESLADAAVVDQDAIRGVVGPAA